MDEIIDTLSREFSRLSPQMQRAATLVLDNPGAVAVDSMRALAMKAGVSPPTMLRLAQRLGFESYEVFRDVFKKSITRSGYGDRAADLRRSTDQAGIAGLVEGTMAAVTHSLGGFRDPIFARDIERAADIIVAARKGYIVASGASFGQAVSFEHVCKMALPSIELVNGLGLRAVDGLSSVGAEDAVVAISTSPYAEATVTAATFAHARGAKLTVITDRRSSPIGRIADAAVVIDTHSPHYFPSMVSLSATLEVLSAVIAVKRGPTAVESISQYEANLRANGYYGKGDF